MLHMLNWRYEDTSFNSTILVITTSSFSLFKTLEKKGRTQLTQFWKAFIEFNKSTNYYLYHTIITDINMFFEILVIYPLWTIISVNVTYRSVAICCAIKYLSSWLYHKCLPKRKVQVKFGSIPFWWYQVDVCNFWLSVHTA